MTRQQILDAVMGAFDNRVATREPSVGYYVRLVLAAVWMVWLLIAYVAIIPVMLFIAIAFPVLLIPLIALILTMVIGFGFQLYFMFRSDDDSRPIGKHEEPILHSLVEELCDVIGAPLPAEIRYTFDANAAAGFRGMRGLFSNDLVLTIGTPLVAGMSIPSFIGVISHELGHFAQAGGMRLSYFCGRVVQFFEYGTGIAKLTQDMLNATDEESPLGCILGLLCIPMAFVLLFFYVFLLLSKLAVMFISRTQEYDADSYEAELVGSDQFERTSSRLMELNFGWYRAFYELVTGEDPPKDCVHFVDWVVYCANHLTEEEHDIIDEITHCRTGMFDTHPSHIDRGRGGRSARFSWHPANSRVGPPALSELRQDRYRTPQTPSPKTKTPLSLAA